MKRKGKESKLNVALSSLLVFFVCALCFAIGVISGKGWSDREYKVRHIENDSQLKAAREDTEPLGDEMTEKEVEMLTKRALEEAKAEQPTYEPDAQMNPETKMNDMGEMAKDMLAANDKPVKEKGDKPEKPLGDKPKGDEKPEGEKPEGRDASMAMTKMDGERNVSSVKTRPTTPKPTAVEYTVQVAAYKTIEEAEKHAKSLIDKGFPGFPMKKMIKGELWYGVSIGSFKSRKAAMKYNRQLIKQAVVKDTFVQKIKRLKK